MVLNVVVAIYYFAAVYQLSSWQDINGSEIGIIIGKVIAISIVGSIILHVIFINNKKEEKKDERDIAINAKGNVVGYYSLAFLCCVIIGHIMLNEGLVSVFPGRTFLVNGPFAMHLLLLALLISSFGKLITQIFCYRRGY